MTKRLSPHFTLPEMIRSRTAKRKGIDNFPDTGQRLSLERLCVYLECVRKLAGPLRVTSGFRSLALNRAIGGADRSFHTRGLAADLQSIRGLSNQELARICASTGLPDLTIEESLNGREWVHVQINEVGIAPRGKCLLARKVNGKTTYIPCGPDFAEE